ncbi:MAG TPA: GNAT family N-acetyltransferase [Candidatus Limnocylindrales bacterium]|nr:GNAT family N-acetyltransferase [Candidatus Limnocylindrales bacterium]
MNSPATERPRPTIRGAIRVEPMRPRDAAAVLRIYGEGIATGNATLDTTVPTWEAWDAAHRPDCRFVARIDGQVIGWTALSAYSARPVYAGVAWESVYVAAAARGQGAGGALLARLVPASERAGVWTLMAGIQVENAASLRLHERTGFRRIGVQRRVGQDGQGRWRDVVLLERRSEAVGR